MTKSFKSKNPVFDPFLVHFPKFVKEIWLSDATSYGSLAPCQNSGKIMIQFQENAWTEGQTEGWTDPIL